MAIIVKTKKIFVISSGNTQSMVPQNFVRFENKKYNYRISDPVQIVELFALCLTVCFGRERNILWNRELACLIRYHPIQQARMMTN